jgi:phenylpropionate dioxygenase-like ring-hydroxylating dioxygenase large terminal subunit
MLTREENELVSRVGPGTPMGDLMRCYWLPALLSSELPSPDADPVRVVLLGEELIAFRDTAGRVGLLAHNCPHRGASLFFGRNEEAGLRCVYHGWKFDADGACIDMPNEPAESDFRNKVRAVAYPTLERGGIVWAYMGPRSEPPPLPDLEPNMLPGAERHAGAIQRACNWLQALEGDIDTSHLGFLHLGAVNPEQQVPGTFNYYTVSDRCPRYAVVDTDAGAMYGAYRPATAEVNYWRIAQFLFPFYALIPSGVLGLSRLVRAWVPMDDEHTMFFVMGAQGSVGAGIDLRQVQPNTSDWYGRFRLAQTADNDYQIDRHKQRSLQSYTGLSSVHLEDLAITESMGTLLDRSAEHLGTSDVMVIRVRRRLIAAAKALQESGEIPPGADNPLVYRTRSGSVFLPKDADWITATEDLRKGFVEHPELDPEPKALA